MILFLLRKKWRYYFSAANLTVLTVQLLTALQIIMIFILSGLFYQYTLTHTGSDNAKSTLRYLHQMVFLLPCLLYFFPNIQVRDIAFQPYHPVHPFTKSAITLTLSIFSKISTFSFLCVPVVLFLSVRSFTYSDYFLLNQLIISGIMLAELLLLLFHNTQKWIFVTTLLLPVSAVVRQDIIYIFSQPVFSVGLLLLNLLAGMHHSGRKEEKSVTYKKIASPNWSWATLTRNKEVFTAITTGIIVQAGMLWVVLTFVIDDIPFVLYFSVLPLGIFSYCYNNSWGFFRPFALTYFLAGRNMTDYVVLYLRLLAPAILLSQLINVTVVYITGHNISHIQWLTLTAITIFTIVTALYSSFLLMKKPAKNNALYRSTNDVSTLPMYITAGVAILTGVISSCQIYLEILLLCVSLTTLLAVYILFRFPLYFIGKLKENLASP